MKNYGECLFINFDKLMTQKMLICKYKLCRWCWINNCCTISPKIYSKKTPWAHLDIAGWLSKYGGALNSGGATGYGVRY